MSSCSVQTIVCYDMLGGLFDVIILSCTQPLFSVYTLSQTQKHRHKTFHNNLFPLWPSGCVSHRLAHPTLHIQQYTSNTTDLTVNILHNTSKTKHPELHVEEYISRTICPEVHILNYTSRTTHPELTSQDYTSQTIDTYLHIEDDTERARWPHSCPRQREELN